MTDREIIRELAKQYMQMACSEKQQRMNQRMKDTNDLKIVRPPVLIDEIPWYQMEIDHELTCLCQDPRARQLETHLRRGLYRWKYLKADTLFEPFYRIPITIESSGYGWDAREEVLKTEEQNHIISHQYGDVLATEEDVERFHLPEYRLNPQKDEDDVNFYSDLLGDTMPVKLCGCGYLYCMPWDEIVTLRGMEPILYDFYDRPEHLHAIMEKMCSVYTSKMDFVEKYAFVDNQPAVLHCTPALVSGLAESGWKATWFRGAAQGFGTVSPKMHEEFEIN